MKFYKMHGLGNDYIYFDCMKKELSDPENLSKKLSDRHFGVGGDGIILLCRSSVADCRMRMFNADGSEGRMCGNGIRCLAKLARLLGYVKGESCTVETLSGVKKLRFLCGKDGSVEAVRVDMGAPELKGAAIPSTFSGDSVVGAPLKVGNREYSVTLVNMGNPHCVIFEDPDTADVEGIGRAIEAHPAFPDRVNVEFVKVAGQSLLKMRVWERGSGETYACGTGACASAVAATLNGYCERGKEITVALLGGELKIEYGETVYMTGGATLVFTGELEEENL